MVPSTDLCRIVAGTKSDLEHMISKEEMLKIVSDSECSGYFEMSSLTGAGISAPIEACVRLVQQRRKRVVEKRKSCSVQ